MEQNFSTLTILAEVTNAFVAFSAIVASLRVTLGDNPDRDLLAALLGPRRRYLHVGALQRIPAILDRNLVRLIGSVVGNRQ